MAGTRREEERSLSRDELALADRARSPVLRDLGQSELSNLIWLLRDRRDRARSIADRQRREMHGKAHPAGSAPAAGDSGSRAKATFLTLALRRAQDEAKRRGAGVTSSQGDFADNVRALKEAVEAARPEVTESRIAEGGTKSIPTERVVPSGAFDDVGDRPGLERTREVR